MDREDDLLPLSALQHLLFWERQCALIHVEQQWAENRYTAGGRIMHERVDCGRAETRKDVRLEFGLPLRSLRLGLIGKVDAIEFHRFLSQDTLKLLGISGQQPPHEREYGRHAGSKEQVNVVLHQCPGIATGRGVG
jgi:hypothetical protein